MKTTHILLSSCLLALSSLTTLDASGIATDISLKSKPATIKALICKKSKGALLEIKGRYRLYDPTSSLEIASSSVGQRDFLEPSENSMKWGSHLPPGINQMRIVPDDSQCTTLVNGIQYKGCVEVYCMNGQLNIVNEIDIESYLKSTLTAQFPEELDKDVMEAIAIVARTNAYYFISRNQQARWHIDNQDGSYLGYAVTLQNLHVDRAIENTKHTILTLNNEPFAATWTKDSAGKTAQWATIFRKNAPCAAGVSAPFAQMGREKRAWTHIISKSSFAKALGMTKIAKADLYLDKESGKAYGLKVSDGSKSRDIDFLKLQKIVGKEKLRSNDFTIELKGEKVIFSGFGEGMGVGLCLYSAEQMIKHGEGTTKILAAFFPGAKIDNRRS
jgi:stage II sporulation protein D